MQYPVCLTRCPLEDLFIKTPTRLLLEAFSTPHSLRDDYSLTYFIFINAHIAIFIYTVEWTGALWKERKCLSFRRAAKGIVSVLSYRKDESTSIKLVGLVWSGDPNQPQILSDQQAVLCGGPVVLLVKYPIIKTTPCCRWWCKAN